MSNIFKDNVIIEIDVMFTSMMNRISIMISGTQIITISLDRSIQENTKLIKKEANPSGL